jgi:hypothetical protein
MRMFRTVGLFVLLLMGILLAPAPVRADVNKAPVVRGPDELYWVPTLDQAKEMSAATGRPIFLMGYSLVGDGSTYDKKGDEFCSGVY